MFARIGSERVCLPYWLPPRKRTERATLPREGPPRVGVPNCTGLVPGSDVSRRHATKKSRQSSAAAACLIASANVARNHVRSSGDRSETRRSPSLRREHNRSLSRQRPERVPAVVLNMGIGDLAGKHAAGSEREMAELQLGAARTTCEDAFAGHRDSPSTRTTAPARKRRPSRRDF